MHFAFPLAFLLLPLPILLWWASTRLGAARRAAVGFSDLGLLDVTGAVRPSWETHAPLALSALALVLLVVGLARPQFGMSVQKTTSDGLDIILCLDTSGSMKAEDLQPTRIDAARMVSKAFVRARPDDRIGLVVFAAVAFTQCPLTTDHEALERMLDTVSTKTTHTDGTAIGNALVTCVNRLKDVPGKSKVIILMTDGRNNCGEISPLDAAKLAAQFGIKIYTIGMGSQGDAPITVRDAFGNRETVRIRADLDVKTLQAIANATGGRFFRATDTGALAGVYNSIDHLEKRKAPETVVVGYHDLYPWFVLPALGLLALSAVLERTIWQEVP